MIVDSVEDEEKWLVVGITSLQQNAFYMHRALDSNNLRDALKYSMQMLSELRTSKLSPHKCYELYMQSFDELRKLEMFFKEEALRGCLIVEFYELMQKAGNILLRLYVPIFLLQQFLVPSVVFLWLVAFSFLVQKKSVRVCTVYLRHLDCGNSANYGLLTSFLLKMIVLMLGLPIDVYKIGNL